MSTNILSRRTARLGLVAAVALGLALATPGLAGADPNPGSPGTPPAGKTASQIYAGVGADAFAELTNNFASQYNATLGSGDPVVASYDAVNPVTSAAGENITTKPGCSVARPNGANAGLSLIKLNNQPSGDTTNYCVDFVRSSRDKGGTDNALTFYAQSRDAVGYSVVGNAYAPKTLTSAQLKDIFECTDTDWSQVGGQAGPIHVYLPPDSAATLTFFLTAIGTNLTNIKAGCSGDPRVIPAQQNDGRSMQGDPQGISPYAVTKWAAQDNEPDGIVDYRGGAQLGFVNTAVDPTTTTSSGGHTYRVLNAAFTTANPTYGRYFYNVVRNGAPDALKSIFGPTGYLCTHQEELLVPFGNTVLGTSGASGGGYYCGQSF